MPGEKAARDAGRVLILPTRGRMDPIDKLMIMERLRFEGSDRKAPRGSGGEGSPEASGADAPHNGVEAQRLMSFIFR